MERRCKAGREDKECKAGKTGKKYKRSKAYLVNRITALLLTLLIAAMNLIETRAEEESLTLYAKAAVLMDADSGRVLYGKNVAEQLPMASTTKIMTLLIALERGNLSDVVTVSAYAASMPDVQLNIREGEQYYLKDLLYSLMLESHNDSAVAIAEHVGGSVEQFAQYMNMKAKEIGCKNTWFITPNGLDASADYSTDSGEKITRTHATTAEDLALIMSYCITKTDKKEQFLEITRTPSYSFSEISGKRSFSCNNHNAFLSMMEGALSGKTGFTGNAGYCYVGALRRDGRTYVVALLACGWPSHKTYKWSDTRKLMEYGLSNFQSYDVAKTQVPVEALTPIAVSDARREQIGKKVEIDVIMEEEKPKGTLLLSANQELAVEYKRQRELTAPVAKGQRVGTLYYLIGDEIWKEIALVTGAAAQKTDYSWCLEMIIKSWLF